MIVLVIVPKKKAISDSQKLKIQMLENVLGNVRKWVYINQALSYNVRK
jgi:hypothetical protein